LLIGYRRSANKHEVLVLQQQGSSDIRTLDQRQGQIELVLDFLWFELFGSCEWGSDWPALLIAHQHFDTPLSLAQSFLALA
jgi:hypothetical protein